MNDSWEILNKELMYHGFKPIGDNKFIVFQSNGSEKTVDATTLIDEFTRQIDDNISLFRDLWTGVKDTLSSRSCPSSLIDPISKNIFINSLKDLAKMLEMFEEADDSLLSFILDNSLRMDIYDFSIEQIKTIPDYKISIDWVHRLICRMSYVRKLLFFYMQGKNKVINYKFAKGISGPWANLDLPMQERVFSWDSEDENFRGRSRDIRNQRRYRKGLEEYNNDGRVGEGHYWRELRNEPFSWYDRDEEDPYPTRSVLSRW